MQGDWRKRCGYERVTQRKAMRASVRASKDRGSTAPHTDTHTHTCHVRTHHTHAHAHTPVGPSKRSHSARSAIPRHTHGAAGTHCYRPLPIERPRVGGGPKSRKPFHQDVDDDNLAGGKSIAFCCLAESRGRKTAHAALSVYSRDSREPALLPPRKRRMGAQRLCLYLPFRGPFIHVHRSEHTWVGSSDVLGERSRFRHLVLTVTSANGGKPSSVASQS